MRQRKTEEISSVLSQENQSSRKTEIKWFDHSEYVITLCFLKFINEITG